MKKIRIRGLTYSADGYEILRDISLDATQGEFIGLIGPNGAGKTTLLKCMNGILKGTGKIEINGIDLNDYRLKDLARGVSLLHQDTAVTFPFQVIDIVLMGRYPHKGFMDWETENDYAIARKYLSLVDASYLEPRPVTQVSGGERQRVMLARILAQETGILLLDEPTSNLDIAHEESIFRMASELSSSGKIVIAAVHDIKIASRHCSRLVLMKEGSILADGRPEQVLTSENLSDAYGVNALVYKNRITGSIDYFIHHTQPDDHRKRIHVIGGGGSAAGVIRFLFERGHKMTAGVFPRGDSDILACETFGAEHVVCEPFSEIDELLHLKNIGLIQDADLTILCNMPFGAQNLKNIEAARNAANLVIIEDDDPAARDYTCGTAMEIYRELRKKAMVVGFAALHEVI